MTRPFSGTCSASAGWQGPAPEDAARRLVVLAARVVLGEQACAEGPGRPLDIGRVMTDVSANTCSGPRQGVAVLTSW